MSDNNNFSSGYDMDNEEYRAIFQRIETSGKRYSDDSDTNSNINYKENVGYRQQTGTAGRPKASAPSKASKSGKNEMFNIENLGSVVNAVKGGIADGIRKMKEKPKKKLPLITRLYKASAVIFAGILMFFGFVSMVDKNKTVSEEENRKLAEKPKFSFSALFSGEYTVQFENFYSDNFPLRSFFTTCSGKINEVFTRYSGNDDEVFVQTETKNDFAGEGVDVLGEKKKAHVMKENTAAVTPDSEASMQGGLLIAGDRAMEVYYHSDTNAQNYASIINKTAKSMPEGVKFYSMLCPTAIEFYGTAEYREGVHSQRDSILKVNSMLDSSIIKVDAYSNLVDSTAAGDYAYFRSDHHWTARGAYCGYQAFCDASGNTAPALSSFKTHKIDGFLGSLYRSANYSSALKNNPDYVECFELSVDASNVVYPDQNLNPSDGFQTYVVAGDVNDSNKYLAFIAGDQPIEKITTSVKNGKKILVLKESYGNALVPFLCNNYEEVYVIDPRWVNMNLADFVAKNGIQEVMAINYMFAIGNQTYCGALSDMS